MTSSNIEDLASHLKYNPIVHDKNFQTALSQYTIKCVAPASGTSPDQIKQLKTLPGINLDLPHDLNTQNIAFHANIDSIRLELLKDALLDETPNTIIWSLRGGYGAARLMNELMQIKKPATEKIFIGFSDITVLHLFLAQKWQWKTIHGPGLLELLNDTTDPGNMQKVIDIIQKKTPYTTISELKLLNPNKCHFKKISGKLTGGNLTLVQTSLGTSWQIKTMGKILFLEDVSEKGYYIDRALNHLKQAAVLNKVKAIVFGEFFAPRDDKIDFALQRFADETSVPIFKTNQFGHGKYNHPIIYHADSHIMKDPVSESYILKIKI